MKKNSILSIALVTTLTLTSLAFAEEKLNLLNPGFEDGFTSWAANDKGMSAVVPEAAHNGKAGLRVIDKSAQDGSSATSSAVPVVAGKKYQLRFWSRIVEGAGLGVYIIFFDAQNKPLNEHTKKNEIIMAVSGAEWKEYALNAVAPEGATSVKVWVHSYSSGQVTADIDDMTLVSQ